MLCIPYNANAGNVRDVWGLLDEWGSSEDSRGRIKEALRLCPAAKLDSMDAVNELKEWLQAAFDSLVIFNSLPAHVFISDLALHESRCCTTYVFGVS